MITFTKMLNLISYQKSLLACSIFISVSVSCDIKIFQFINKSSTFVKSGWNLYHFEIFIYPFVPTAKTPFCSGHRSPYLYSIFSRRKISFYIWGEFETVKMPANESICIKLFDSGKELSIKAEPSKIGMHKN